MKDYEYRIAQNKIWVETLCPDCGIERLCYYENANTGWGSGGITTYHRGCGECDFSEEVEMSNFKGDRKKNKTTPFNGEKHRKSFFSSIFEKFTKRWCIYR